MLFYKEKNGDYLCIDPESKGYYVAIGHSNLREGRATNISNDINSL